MKISHKVKLIPFLTGLLFATSLFYLAVFNLTFSTTIDGETFFDASILACVGMTFMFGQIFASLPIEKRLNIKNVRKAASKLNHYKWANDMLVSCQRVIQDVLQSSTAELSEDSMKKLSSSSKLIQLVIDSHDPSGVESIELSNDCSNFPTKEDENYVPQNLKVTMSFLFGFGTLGIVFMALIVFCKTFCFFSIMGFIIGLGIFGVFLNEYTRLVGYIERAHTIRYQLQSNQWWDRYLETRYPLFRETHPARIASSDYINSHSPWFDIRIALAYDVRRLLEFCAMEDFFKKV